MYSKPKEYYIFQIFFAPKMCFPLQWPWCCQAVLAAQEPAASATGPPGSERPTSGKSDLELHHPVDLRTEAHPLVQLGLQSSCEHFTSYLALVLKWLPPLRLLSLAERFRVTFWDGRVTVVTREGCCLFLNSVSRSENKWWFFFAAIAAVGSLPFQAGNCFESPANF